MNAGLLAIFFHGVTVGNEPSPMISPTPGALITQERFSSFVWISESGLYVAVDPDDVWRSLFAPLNRGQLMLLTYSLSALADALQVRATPSRIMTRPFFPRDVGLHAEHYACLRLRNYLKSRPNWLSVVDQYCLTYGQGLSAFNDYHKHFLPWFSHCGECSRTRSPNAGSSSDLELCQCVKPLLSIAIGETRYVLVSEKPDVEDHTVNLVHSDLNFHASSRLRVGRFPFLSLIGRLHLLALGAAVRSAVEAHVFTLDSAPWDSFKSESELSSDKLIEAHASWFAFTLNDALTMYLKG